MNNAVLEHDVIPNPINIGSDEETASSKISYQLAQDFYNEITGKSETLTDSSREPFILKQHHIEQLDAKIEQYLEQYNVVSINSSFVVNYVNDSAERFSCLSRFKLHVGANGKAIEDISIRYNLLIILPRTNRPQEYKINIKLVSRIAKIEKAREEMKELPFDIALSQFEIKNLVEFSIDYVDISVANAIMSLLKSWFEAIEKKPMSPALKSIRKHSSLFPTILKFGALLLSSYYLFLFSDKFITNNIDLNLLVKFLISSFLLLFFSYKMGRHIGRRAEINLDSVYEQSYMEVTEADKNFIEQSSANIRANRNKLIISIFSALMLGVIGSVIASIFTG